MLVSNNTYQVTCRRFVPAMIWNQTFPCFLRLCYLGLGSFQPKIFLFPGKHQNTKHLNQAYSLFQAFIFNTWQLEVRSLRVRLLWDINHVLHHRLFFVTFFFCLPLAKVMSNMFWFFIYYSYLNTTVMCNSTFDNFLLFVKIEKLIFKSTLFTFFFLNQLPST